MTDHPLPEDVDPRLPGDGADEPREGDEELIPDSADGFYWSVIEGVTDGIFAADAEGRILYANEGMGNVVGHDPEDIQGRPLAEIVSRIPEPYRELFEEGVAVDRIPSEAGPIDVQVRDAGGTELWASMSLAPAEHGGRTIVSGVLRDVEERKAREGELEQYETILSAVDDGIYILDSNFRILEVNEAMTSMTGYSQEELVGSHASLLAGEDVLEEAALLSQELLRSDREAANITTEINQADGGQLAIETRFSLYPLDDGEYGQVGVVRDITERKQFEETLTALNRSTRDLLGATSESEICRRIVDTADDLLELSSATVYLFDTEESVLVPTATSDGAAREHSDPPAISPGDGPGWNAFVEDETVASEAQSAAGGSRELYIPLEDRGVFVVGASEEFDDESRVVLNLLAANMKTALDRVEGKAEIRKRERELQEQNERLRRLDQLNEIIRDINAAAVQADTIEGIEQEVCDRLVASAWFEFAWIGDRDPSTSEIVPETWSGSAQGYLDAVSFDLGEAVGEPTTRAIDTEEVVHVPNVAADLGTSGWRKPAVSRGFETVVSIPLRYGELTYGVLSAYGSRPTATDDMIHAVLGELGETIANAMNAVEVKQSLLTNSGIELTLRFTASDDVLFRLGQELASHMEFESVVPRVDGSTRVFFTVGETSADQVREVRENSIAIREIRTIADRDSTTVFEAEIEGETIASTLVDRGATIEYVTVDDQEMTLGVELPANADVRSVVERVKSRYPDVELIGRHRHEQPARTKPGFRATLEDRLSDRQFEIAQIAYHSGYFEWPRERTSVEVAESLDIAQPTFSRHLRVAEQKLFALLFE